ncbi:hypothetical protein BU25DRAFT_463495 [Macroventuria anomochaeta]|uniref:Uncharacterized protein n=1 Tax=Macroventuria anomochaeta TaxID=301207 RepID=A0ACB6RII9_9PLEO|nr:uncharacterized protein BU25DRAFT_463495 [Macroventuria anomochaeta]KAF2621706.1 hypothetical protein BU25DRAFT_463495 [Macroventuria anomochaeta]
MSQQLPDRVSKTKAAEKMAAMIVQPLPALTESEGQKIRLTFARDIWNAYTPRTQSSTISPIKSKEGQKRKRKPTPIKTEDDASTKKAKQSPPILRQCKVKVSRFQYGGPDARVGGRYRDMITLETPCFQTTCKNCWMGHGHLMRSLSRTDSAHNLEHPEMEPLSPAVDPMIVNDEWQMYQSRRNSTTDISALTVPSARGQISTDSSPILTPVDAAFATQCGFNRLLTPSPYTSTAPATPQKYNIFLPTSLLRHTASQTLPSKTRWRETSRQHHTVRLAFSTNKGRAEFKSLVHEQAKKGIKRERERLRRATKQVVREILGMEGGGDGVKRKRRSHKLKLAFKSRTGKESYKRLIETYLRQG